jgi:hypothetical protein
MISFQTLKQALAFMFPHSDVALRQEFDGTVHAVVIHRFHPIDLVREGMNALVAMAPRAIPSRTQFSKPHRWASAPYNKRRK